MELKTKLILACCACAFILIGVGLIRSEYLLYQSNQKLNTLNKEYLQGLEKQKEDHYLKILDFQKDIKRKNVTLDSLNIELLKKTERLNNIHNDVQLLKGDSVGIATTLNRILAR